MTTVEILKAARELISTPEKWTKSSEACFADGVDCGVMDEDAACFCAIGAVYRTLGARNSHPALRILASKLDDKYLLRKVDSRDADDPDLEADDITCVDGALMRPRDPDDAIPDFNDDDRTEHRDILALFDRAIAAAEATP